MFRGYTPEQRLEMMDDILMLTGNPGIEILRFVADMQITLRNYYDKESGSKEIPDDQFRCLTTLKMISDILLDCKPELSEVHCQVSIN